MNARTVICVLAALVFVGGCGGASAADKKASAESKAKAAQIVEEAKAEQKAQELRKVQEAKMQACSAQIAGFIDKLHEINSRLAVGMNYSEYGDRIGDARVAYDKIDVDKLYAISPRCLNAAASLEGSFNKYGNVLKIWGDCIDGYGCDFSKGATNDRAQAAWITAGKLLDKGENQLAGIATAGAS